MGGGHYDGEGHPKLRLEFYKWRMSVGSSLTWFSPELEKVEEDGADWLGDEILRIVSIMPAKIDSGLHATGN